MRAKKPANYNTAKADCVSKQGNLLVVNGRDEMDFLAGKLIIFLIISKIYVYDITWIIMCCIWLCIMMTLDC